VQSWKLCVCVCVCMCVCACYFCWCPQNKFSKVPLGLLTNNSTHECMVWVVEVTEKIYSHCRRNELWKEKIACSCSQWWYEREKWRRIEWLEAIVGFNLCERLTQFPYENRATRIGTPESSRSTPTRRERIEFKTRRSDFAAGSNG